MTHMKLTATNLQSLLDVLEIEDDGTDPDSFDRLCAMAVRDAIDMTARIAELTAEVEKYRKALGCIANGRDINAWLADIARNALKDGV